MKATKSLGDGARGRISSSINESFGDSQSVIVREQIAFSLFINLLLPWRNLLVKK